MLKDTYSEAVLALHKDGASFDELLLKLDTVLEKRGHQKLRGQILRAIETALENAKRSAATLTVAKESDVIELKADIENAAKALDIKVDEFQTEIQDELIGGFILETRSKRIDASHRSKLLSLYERITK